MTDYQLIPNGPPPDFTKSSVQAIQQMNTTATPNTDISKRVIPSGRPGGVVVYEGPPTIREYTNTPPYKIVSTPVSISKLSSPLPIPSTTGVAGVAVDCVPMGNISFNYGTSHAVVIHAAEYCVTTEKIKYDFVTVDGNTVLNSNKSKILSIPPIGTTSPNVLSHDITETDMLKHFETLVQNHGYTVGVKNAMSSTNPIFAAVGKSGSTL